MMDAVKGNHDRGLCTYMVAYLALTITISFTNVLTTGLCSHSINSNIDRPACLKVQNFRLGSSLHQP